MLSVYAFHTVNVQYVSCVCCFVFFCLLQGMPGPQGAIGPPGEKVRDS